MGTYYSGTQICGVCLASRTQLPRIGKICGCYWPNRQPLSSGRGPSLLNPSCCIERHSNSAQMLDADKLRLKRYGRRRQGALGRHLIWARSRALDHEHEFELSTYFYHRMHDPGVGRLIAFSSRPVPLTADFENISGNFDMAV